MVETCWQVTDVGYLVLFLAVAGGMLWLDSQANSLGNVLRLSEPIDYQGKLCGYDEEVGHLQNSPLSCSIPTRFSSISMKAGKLVESLR